jgi:hypothetical protein
VRLDDSVGRNDRFESSSLSENFLDVFFTGDTPRAVSGIADGNKIGLFLLWTGCAVMLVVFPIA